MTDTLGITIVVEEIIKFLDYIAYLEQRNDLLLFAP